MKEKGIFNMNEEIRAKLFTKTSNFMEENGYINYETSNFAKPGYESKHNLTYWEGGEYLGIGSGAHSRIKIKNKWYEIIAEKNPLRYKKENPKNLYFKNKLSNLERANEIILSSMRLKEGLKEETLEKQTDIKFANVLNEKIIEEYQKLKLLVSINTTLKLTDNGRKFANKISADIID
jgi:oxygen-independent coproporphyrinogen-3 oxidase